MSVLRFGFGDRIITNSVVNDYQYDDLKILNHYFDVQLTDGDVTLSRKLDDDKIYGLGENVKGINKRGCMFTSFNEDDPDITEDRKSLYASHNFLIIAGKNTFGVFIDTPKVVDYDLGFSDLDKLVIKTKDGFDLYVIEGNSKTPELDIIHEFREMIGKSYIAPFWAFGVAQSRWGYKSRQDLEDVINGFKEKKLPLDMLFFDIDCLEEFEDFTFNNTFYKDGKIDSGFFKGLKEDKIHLIPIVDAAVKVKDGYFLYDELMKEKGYCTDKDGNPYIVGVWPGDSLLPDYLSKSGSEVFGRGYKKYLDLGIDGFWNDMNEPALFYGKKYINEFANHLRNVDYDKFHEMDFYIIRDKVNQIKNNINDYKSIYHKYDLAYKDNNIVNHYDVHNMYGYKMVEAAHNYFEKYNLENNINKKYLLFSRSSMIGSHRYSGIWTGDNAAYWDHLLLNLKMMPSLNMCGYLYSGADIGGFGHNASEDLLLRWMALGIFTPLFRNHTCNWVRAKDYHLMQRTNIIRNILSIRYALLPYIYSEYIKAVNNDTLLFTPLSFRFRDDERCADIEDELLFGDSLLIAPVYSQNANGRMVYLPIDAIEVRMKSGKDYKLTNISKGDHYIKVDLDEVVFFILDGGILPLAKIDEVDKIKNIESVNYNDLEFIGNIYNKKEYILYYEEDCAVKEKKIKLN